MMCTPFDPKSPIVHEVHSAPATGSVAAPVTVIVPVPASTTVVTAPVPVPASTTADSASVAGSTAASASVTVETSVSVETAVTAETSVTVETAKSETSATETSATAAPETSATETSATAATGSATGSATLATETSATTSATVATETSATLVNAETPSPPVNADTIPGDTPSPIEACAQTAVSEVTEEVADVVDILLLLSKCEADGESAGDSDADAMDFADPPVNDLNHDIIPLKIGLTRSLAGEEVRIILSKIHTKEYITIRGISIPYSDTLEILHSFTSRPSPKALAVKQCFDFYRRLSLIMMLGMALHTVYAVLQSKV